MDTFTARRWIRFEAVTRGVTGRMVALIGVGGVTASAGPVDCATLQVLSTWDIQYREQERFPDPVRTIKKDLYALSAPYRFVGCGVTVNATSTQLAIQAASTRALLDVMGGQWRFPFYGVERRAGKLAFTDAARILIDLPDGLMNTAVEVSGYAMRPYLPRDAVMAVRADGGKLQPLLYDGRFRRVTVDPKVKTLEIIVKSSRGVLWERMYLDVVHTTMTFSKTSRFPDK